MVREMKKAEIEGIPEGGERRPFRYDRNEKTIREWKRRPDGILGLIVRGTSLMWKGIPRKKKRSLCGKSPYRRRRGTGGEVPSFNDRSLRD